MVDFSSQPTMKGFFAPTRFEADVYDCEVTGKIPTDLNGAFVRLGGDWLYPPKFEDDSPFSMDGYINMFRFKNGIVDYKGRWVKTPRYKADLAAHKQLFGKYRNPFTDDPSVHDLDRTVQNTTPLCFAGKLFTLKEDSLPYEIDPKTLETVGPYDFHGKYKSLTFTAHPKVDPVTGEMICYGYEATGLETQDVFLYTIDKTGHVKREVRFQVPYVAMVHDIGLTQKHVIIPVFGFVSSMERLKEGKVHWGWDNTKPAYVGIIPRDGEAKDIRWFKGPSRATVHTLNARTEGEKVILEARDLRWESVSIFSADRWLAVGSDEGARVHSPQYVQSRVERRRLHRGKAFRNECKRPRTRRRPLSFASLPLRLYGVCGQAAAVR